MTETKKILLIGRTGRGKSTLANVITGMENKFKEGSGSISETRKIQSEKFKDNNISYLVIDTPGIGDTRLPTEEILDIIAEAVYLVRDGASQVLFVTNGRFDQYEMITYDLLRETIFDKYITNHTSIIRTRFENFKSKNKCEEDINLMIKEVEDKKIKLEAKEKEIKDMLYDSEQYQKLSAEIEKLKKELANTNLAEIVESCQKRIVYVNNPSTEVEDINELELNRKNRIKSREKLLEHLKNSCQEIPYKPPKLANLSEEIVGFMEEKMKWEAELKSLSEPKNNQNLWIENSKKKSETSSVEDSKTELFIGNEETNKTTTSSKKLFKFGIGVASRRRIKKEKTKQDETIRQLEENKAKLRKQIREKEKIIRQKVRNHVLNNYNDVVNIEGGDIFIDSIIDVSSWQEIHEKFTNKELVKEWLSNRFDYEQTQELAKVLGNNFQPTYAGFCAWLRDNKKLKPEEAVNYEFEKLKNDYYLQLGKEIDIYNQHNQWLSLERQVENDEESRKQQFKSYLGLIPSNPPGDELRSLFGFPDNELYSRDDNKPYENDIDSFLSQIDLLLQVQEEQSDEVKIQVPSKGNN